MDHGLHGLGNVLIVQDKHRRLAAQFEDALLELRSRNACDDAAHPIATYEVDLANDGMIDGTLGDSWGVFRAGWSVLQASRRQARLFQSTNNEFL
jgi:hypothetical protein